MTEELPDTDHQAPPGVGDDAVAAVGRVTEALETCERARGHLYAFHQLTGSADAKLGEALTALRDSGHPELADEIEADLLGRNVLPGRWTFQVVEEYDDGYWSRFRDWERTVRDTVLAGRRHVHEARLKQRSRTVDRPGHDATPG